MTFEEQLAKSEGATKVIGEYLLNRSLTDMSISDNLKKENKNLKECFEYICQEAQKKKTGNCAVIDDSEVFGMAIHYYDEDKIKVSSTSENVKATTSDIKEQPVKPIVEKKVKTKQKKNGTIDGQISLF